jgi:glucose-6-phosphate 1-dehydrogenase
MLLPSLYFLDADGFLPKAFRIIATARSEMTTEDFLKTTRATLCERVEGCDDAVFARSPSG